METVQIKTLLIGRPEVPRSLIHNRSNAKEENVIRADTLYDKSQKST